MDRTTEAPLSQLIARLNGQAPAERFHAVLTLGSMGRKARKAVPALIETLKDIDMNVRKAAALALADIGPDAREAVPGLCEVMLNDPEAAVRRRAAVSLGEIGTGEAVAALEGASVGDESKEVRETAAAALVEIGAGAGRAAA